MNRGAKMFRRVFEVAASALLLILVASPCLADWAVQSPLPPPIDLRGVWGASNTDVFAVGYSGTILHYDGTSLALMNSRTAIDLFGVWGSTSNDVFAVGSYGTVLHYNGNGTRWATVNSGTTEDLFGVWGTTNNDIFTVGDNGTILHYDGISFTELNSGTTDGLYGVWGTADNDVFAVGDNGTILHYNGTGWEAMSGGTSNSLNGVWGTAHNDVFAVGDNGKILHYNGTNWTALNAGTPADLFGVWGSTSNDVFAVGDRGGHNKVLHYDGTSWTTIQILVATVQPLHGVWGSMNNDVFVVGDNGNILFYDRTSWTAVSSGIRQPLYGVSGSTSNDVFAVGSTGGRIVHYDGTSWTTTSTSTGAYLKEIWAAANNNVFAVGQLGTIQHFNGTSWTVMPSATTEDLNGVWGAASDEIFSVGDSGTILHYDGTNWATMNSGTTDHLYGVWGSSSSDVFAVGELGRILHYNGTNWETMNSGTTNYLNGVWGSADNDVFVVGDEGYGSFGSVIILHYDGSSWVDMNMHLSGSLNSVWGTASDDVFGVGSNGTILHYDGTSWIDMSFGVASLDGVWGTAKDDVFVVGDLGTILHLEPSSPEANFSYVATGLEVNFTDESSSDPTSWAWDFGDGITSDEQNPTHSYAAGGTFTVALTASNGMGSSAASKDITVKTLPEAAFLYDVTFLDVVFTDASINDPTSWVWDFGDESTSEQQNPTHSYATGGTYTVTLTASNEQGSNTATEDITVSADSAQCTPIYIAAAASGSGAGDSIWATDLGINNAGDEALTYKFRFLPRGDDNSAVGYTEEATLQPDTSANFANIWSLYTGSDGAGAIEVCVSNPEASGIVSRTYNTGDLGTFGQTIVGIKGMVPETLIATGETARLGFLTENSDFRTNVGFMNVGATAITINAEFFESDGSSLGTSSIDLPLYSNKQWNRAFRQVITHDVDLGYVDVWTVSGSAMFLTYASVVENHTDDPTTIWPFDTSTIVDGGAFDCTPIWIAAAASADGASGTVWATDLGINNLSSDTLTYRFHFLPRGSDNTGVAMDGSFDLAGNAAVAFPDIWQSMTGAKGVGAINVCVDNGDAAGIISRTYNTSDEGTFGQSIVGKRGAAPTKVGTGEKARLGYLFQNDAYRTNIGFMNAGATEITIKGEFFDNLGSFLGFKILRLAPYSNSQWNNAFTLEPILADDISGGFVDIWTDTPDAAFLTFASIVDNGTGDPSTVWPF